jgi:hypothetical protein
MDGMRGDEFIKDVNWSDGVIKDVNRSDGVITDKCVEIEL